MAPSWLAEPDTGMSTSPRRVGGNGTPGKAMLGVGELADLGPGEKDLALDAEAGVQMMAEDGPELVARVVFRPDRGLYD